MQNHIECNDHILQYSADNPCLINEIKLWQHGQVDPLGNYSFFNNPPKLDGQIGVPNIVDDILGITKSLLYRNK